MCDAAGAGERAGEQGAFAECAESPDGRVVARSDLRGTADVRTLRFTEGDLLVVSGLPGSGKSTLMGRVAAVPDTVPRIDSQETRERWAARLPRRLPYALYRPLVRVAHYARLWRTLATGGSVVVHDCGTQSWVRGWLARHARRRGRALHLVLLDVPAATALHGQRQRGRGVSARAFARHLKAVRGLLADAEADGCEQGGEWSGERSGGVRRLPGGCASAILLDRGSAEALVGLVFL